MKKIIYGIGVLLLFVACILPFTRADGEVAFKTIQKEVKTIVSNYPEDFIEKDKRFIRKVYELNDSDYTTILSYGATSAMEVNEICIAYYDSEEQKQHLVAQLQARIDHQYKSFAGYAPRQADLLKKAVLLEKRKYVILIIHKDSETIKENLSALF